MLIFADVEVELENDSGRIRQQSLESVDVLITRAPDLLWHEFMDSHHQHILIMRAVEDFDVSCRGCLGVYAPEEIVGEFFFRRDFKRSYRAALRVQRTRHLADRTIFPAGIASLQDDEYALPPHRVKKFLQFTQLFDEPCRLLLSLLTL